ncbi:MAG: DUF309 domain-containing protein [Vulcanococcus sp.]
MSSSLDVEEQSLMVDPRLGEAIRLFNDQQWYACHDGFEELWHETQGPIRKVLQGILQIAVAHHHLERGNQRGAMVLLGEGLGRLQGQGPFALGLQLEPLRAAARARLLALHQATPLEALPLPRLICAQDLP